MIEQSKGKATRMRFTPEQKIAIYEHFCASNGKLNQEQLGQWAFKEFNLKKPISQSTISNIIINPEKHYKNVAKGVKGTSSRSGKMPALEKDIEDYIVAMTKEGTRPNRASIVAYAKAIANTKYHMNEMPASEQLNFSDGWLTRTLARLAARHEDVNSTESESSKLEGQIKRIQEPKRKIAKVPTAVTKRSKKRMNLGYLCASDGSNPSDAASVKEAKRIVVDPEVAKQELKDGIEKVLAYWLPISEEEEKVLPILRNALLEIRRDEKNQQRLKQSSIHQYFK
jgi:hypothetical protein